MPIIIMSADNGGISAAQQAANASHLPTLQSLQQTANLSHMTTPQQNVVSSVSQQLASAETVAELPLQSLTSAMGSPSGLSYQEFSYTISQSVGDSRNDDTFRAVAGSVLNEVQGSGSQVVMDTLEQVDLQNVSAQERTSVLNELFFGVDNGALSTEDGERIATQLQVAANPLTPEAPTQIERVILTDEDSAIAIDISSRRFTGTSGIDNILIQEGVSVEQLNLLGGEDNVHFAGNVSDYDVSSQGTTALFTHRETGAVVEMAVTQEASQISFADGVTAALKVNTEQQALQLGEQLLSGQRSPIELDASPESRTTIEHVILTDEDNGQAFRVADDIKKLTGSNGIDHIVIEEGVSITQLNLLGDHDIVEFAGEIDDYTLWADGTTVSILHNESGAEVNLAASAGDKTLAFSDSSGLLKIDPEKNEIGFTELSEANVPGETDILTSAGDEAGRTEWTQIPVDAAMWGPSVNTERHFSGWTDANGELLNDREASRLVGQLVWTQRLGEHQNLGVEGFRTESQQQRYDALQPFMEANPDWQTRINAFINERALMEASGLAIGEQATYEPWGSHGYDFENRAGQNLVAYCEAHNPNWESDLKDYIQSYQELYFATKEEPDRSSIDFNYFQDCATTMTEQELEQRLDSVREATYEQLMAIKASEKEKLDYEMAIAERQDSRITGIDPEYSVNRDRAAVNLARFEIAFSDAAIALAVEQAVANERALFSVSDA
ncbi:MAG: hypothetical protein MI864_09560 [Pseudomonadales bacterium]|nr:hypothetical protein [Pseudomonadales bacterium]